MVRSKELNSLFYGARLDKATGERLRLEVDKLVKQHNGSFGKVANALGLTTNAIVQMARGQSNGSLGLAFVVAEKTGVPLKDIVGETLAKTAASRISRVREDKAKKVPKPVGRPPASPAVSAVITNGSPAKMPKISFGELLQVETKQKELVAKIRSGSYTEVDLESFVAEYERVKRESRKLKDVLFTFFFGE